MPRINLSKCALTLKTATTSESCLYTRDMSHIPTSKCTLNLKTATTTGVSRGGRGCGGGGFNRLSISRCYEVRTMRRHSSTGAEESRSGREPRLFGATALWSTKYPRICNMRHIDCHFTTWIDDSAHFRDFFFQRLYSTVLNTERTVREREVPL